MPFNLNNYFCIILTMTYQTNWIEKQFHWTEILSDQSELKHIYRPIVNTLNGKLYDDSKVSLVAKKFLLLLVARPFHTLAKTLYHACLPISLPLEFYLAAKKETNKDFQHQFKAGIIGCVKSALDIIRTPLYETALIVCSLFGVFLGTIKSETIYNLRALTGKIELSFLWDNKKSPWMLTPCFQPRDTLFQNLEKSGRRAKTEPDTNYDKPNRKAETNLARSIFQERRNRRFLIYCYQHWPKDIPLDSATYKITC